MADDDIPDEFDDIEAKLDAIALLGDDLVGTSDISDRCGVVRGAVDQWRGRHKETFPHPRLTISTRPVWLWGEIDAWLRLSGRDRLSDHAAVYLADKAKRAAQATQLVEAFEDGVLTRDEVIEIIGLTPDEVTEITGTEDAPHLVTDVDEAIRIANETLAGMADEWAAVTVTGPVDGSVEAVAEFYETHEAPTDEWGAATFEIVEPTADPEEVRARITEGLDAAGWATDRVIPQYHPADDSVPVIIDTTAVEAPTAESIANDY